MFLNSACALDYGKRNLYFKMFTEKDYYRSQTLGLGDLVFLFLRHGPTMYFGWTGTHCIDQDSPKLTPAILFLPSAGIKGGAIMLSQCSPVFLTQP